VLCKSFRVLAHIARPSCMPWPTSWSRGADEGSAIPIDGYVGLRGAVNWATVTERWPRFIYLIPGTANRRSGVFSQAGEGLSIGPLDRINCDDRYKHQTHSLGSKKPKKNDPTMTPTIRIVQPVFIVDTSSAACPPPDVVGLPHTPGHYVALRRIDKGPSGFLRSLRYFGPFQTLDAARLLQTSATALGIVGSPPLFAAVNAVAKNRSVAWTEPHRNASYANTQPAPQSQFSYRELPQSGTRQPRLGDATRQTQHNVHQERIRPCS
jgi:hypothetical protein